MDDLEGKKNKASTGCFKGVEKRVFFIFLHVLSESVIARGCIYVYFLGEGVYAFEISF